MKRYRDIIRETEWIIAPVPVSSPSLSRIHHDIYMTSRAHDPDRPPGSLVHEIHHGFWNYFIQTFYPAITAPTEARGAIFGEFGWFRVLVSIVVGHLFWHLKYLLPKMLKPEGGLQDLLVRIITRFFYNRFRDLGTGIRDSLQSLGHGQESDPKK